MTNLAQVTDNIVSEVTSPKSSFADASLCSPAIQTLFNQNSNLIYYPPGLTGPQTLQSDFDEASANVTNFLCSTTPLPSSTSFSKGSLTVYPNTQFSKLHGVIIQYQGDSNVVVLTTPSAGGETPVWASGHTVSSGCTSSDCVMVFQGDGNLVTYYNGEPQWDTGTQGVGETMVCLDQSPWIQILDASGKVVWDTTSSS